MSASTELFEGSAPGDAHALPLAARNYLSGWASRGVTSSSRLG
jgi:hypothetical protein